MASNLVSGIWFMVDTDSNQLRRASNNGCVRCNSIAEVVGRYYYHHAAKFKKCRRGLFFSDGGIFLHTDKDKLVMDMSTVSPATTDLVAASCGGV